jgi:hypothetical protein
MPHARSLRAIGQSLETAHIEDFVLEKKHDAHVVRSTFLTPTRQWILMRNNLVEAVWDSLAREQKGAQLAGGDGWLSYDSVAILRLDAQGRQKRRSNSFLRTREVKLSGIMRAVGEQLDIMQVNSFNTVWTSDSVTVEYQMPGGQREQRNFSVEKLHELSSGMRFRRSNLETSD